MKHSFQDTIYNAFDRGVTSILNNTSHLFARRKLGYVVGYRIWLADRGSFRLRSITSLRENPSFGEWIPHEAQEAQCQLHRTHKSPVRFCHCGIYAHSMLVSALADWKDVNYFVVGEVALWGNIIKHKNGYRAQFAYPHKFYAFKHLGTMLAEKFGIIYEVPVRYMTLEDIKIGDEGA